jgi:parallel beta-helix repeat protein
VLDCRGFQITGLGGTSEQYGITLSGKPGAEVSGATVKGCRVSRFHRGIRLHAASSSLVADNTATDNGDQRAHVGYGIDVSGGSHNNVLENNRVHGNADEGIHIGTGSHRNRFTGNTSADNYRENLYLLLANGNVFVRNTLGPGGVNSLYLKDSGGNRFEGNTFRGNTARIVGDARDNQFIDNTFSGAGLHFQPYKGTSRSPSNNRVTGGAMTDARECIRFTSSRGNVVEDTDLGGCRTAVRSESPSGPSDNILIGTPSAALNLDEGSTLARGRRVSVHVKDAAGAPVAGAKVQGRDASGASMWEAETDAAGNTPPQVFITEARVGTRTVPRAPFTLIVTKPGYAAETQAVSTVEGASLTVSLRPG